MAKTLNTKNLKAVTLKDLLYSGRIIYLTTSLSEREYHRDRLSEIGDNLVFYVNKKMDSTTPLMMKLYMNRDNVLIPNCPVATLTYEQYSHMAPVLKFHNLGIELPCGYDFHNKRKSPAGKNRLYFKAEKSGWKSDEQGKILESYVEFTFEDGIAKKAKSIIKYKV